MEIRLIKILRLTFFGLNVLITLTGVALMAFSANSLLQRQEFRKESEINKLLVDSDSNVTVKMLVMAMVISILLICISFFGFCGAIAFVFVFTGIHPHGLGFIMIQYLVFVLLNLALVIIGGIIVLRFSKIPQNMLTEYMNDYRYNQTSRDFVDKIRKTLGCCLVHDIYNLEEFKSCIANQIITASCCDSPAQEKCRQLLRDYSFQFVRWEDVNEIVNTKGCINQIVEMSERVSDFILPFCILIGSIDLTAILLSTALCCII